MILSGLDRILEEGQLAGRRFGLLSHAAAVTASQRPILEALAESALGPPAVLFSPEHGFYGVEQDMIPTAGGEDPFFGVPTVSLYGSSAASLRPEPGSFDGLELLLIDLWDVGVRYYTYAASAVWTAQAALESGLEVWVLDRPNPLGGLRVEGNLRAPGFESFVGAFRLPVLHGLSLGELVLLEARRGDWDTAGLCIWQVHGWHREVPRAEDGWVWRSPSPNMPRRETAWVYGGSCLVEATELSEGRGTTRPFELVGSPRIDGRALAQALARRDIQGVTYLPAQFRPQFQKHAGRVCSGVEIVVTDPQSFAPYRSGIELLRTIHEIDPESLVWRREPYEFVSDRPAIDLLTGSSEFRDSLERGANPDPWIQSWSGDEALFQAEREAILLYSAGTE